MPHSRTLGVALSLLAAFVFARPLYAAQDLWSYDSVVEHPRWVDFVRQVNSSYVTDIPDGVVERVCREALRVAVPKKKADDPVSTCIRGVLKTLDEVSDYIDPEEFAEQQAAAKRGFVGIGLELGRKDRGEPLLVVQPIAGAPGERAGILPADRILVVDGTDIVPLSMDETIGVMRGPAGSVMQLTVRRGGRSSRMEFSVPRQEIRLLTVKVKALPGPIGYVRISQFNADTAKQLSERLRALRFPEGQPARGLVLDLRNNPGGSLDALAPVASSFAPPDKPVVVTRGRKVNETMRTHSGSDGSPQGQGNDEPLKAWREEVPVVVLVNERTAGAAEALAQFMRESRAATMLGARTRGAPHVRTGQVIGGDAAVRMVTAIMASPKGANWSNGLAPDALLEVQDGQYEFGESGDQWLVRAMAMFPNAGGAGRTVP